MNIVLTRRLAVLAFAALLPTAAALAQTAEPGGRGAQMAAELQKRFAAADTNGDGRLTRDEAKAKMPMVYKHFDEIDTTHSGSVTLADIAAYARAKQGTRKTAP
jgi:Ca2+-binding EF-hand superfamily protein